MSLLALGAILATAAASSAASLYNNRQNVKNADDANWLSVYLANTAHQREVRDLEAAGLNPILSATGSGAATPQLKTPNLESIDGGIGNSGTSLAKAINGQLDAEAEIAKSEASSAKSVSEIEGVEAEIAKASKGTQLQNAFNDKLEAAARTEAFTGRYNPDVSDLIDTSEARKAYNDLVQQYRNQAESGRYGSSVERQVFKDILSGASSASDIYRTTKGATQGRIRRP